MKNIESKKKMQKKAKIIAIIALIVLAAAVISGAVWIFFIMTSSFTGENVVFSMTGSSESVAGDLVTYQINYANNEKVDLENVEISIIYPDGFSFKSAEPKSVSFNDNKWKIGMLESGTSGSITIKGNLFGEVGSSIVCVANMAYKPKNVSSSFNQSFEAATKINQSELELNANIPETIQRDKEFEFKIKASNKSEFDVNNVRIDIEAPDRFELISSEPSHKTGFAWDFPKIIAGDEEEIIIKGKLSGEIGDKRDIKVKYGLFDEYNNFYLQKEDIYQIEIVDISGDLKLMVNGVENNSKNPGDLMEYTIFYKNTGSEALNDSVITLEFENKELLDEDSVIVDQGQYSEGKANWSYENNSQLQKIEPGQEGGFVYKVKIASPVKVEKLSDKNFSVKAKASMTSKRGSNQEEVTIEGNNVETKINTEIIISPEARYYNYNGSKVGTGPLPPKVGEKTTYRIFMSLANRTNEVENSRIEMSLGEGVEWEGNISVQVGDLKLEGDKVVWDIGKILANTGQFANSLLAEFDVSITPTNSDVGKSPMLVKDFSFQGVDQYTSEKIEQVLEGVDTTLPKDFLAQGKGEVSN